MDIQQIKVNLQYFLPKHLITKIVGRLASAKMGRFTTYAINKFADYYNIDPAEIDGNIRNFQTFNDFFARPLKPSAIVIDSAADSLVFPADGKISQFGDLKENFQLQAKGHYFTTEALLGSNEDAEFFNNGKFITIYLSPKDYHRVHMPFEGKLLKMTYIPGELFSVNPLYTQNIPELFSRNERVVCIFETVLGKMAVVFVGAAIVRSISTKWAGVVAPNGSREVYVETYENRDISFHKGEEIGKFLMGSTVICLFEKDKIEFDGFLGNERATHVGVRMATRNNL